MSQQFTKSRTDSPQKRIAHRFFVQSIDPPVLVIKKGWNFSLPLHPHRIASVGSNMSLFPVSTGASPQPLNERQQGLLLALFDHLRAENPARVSARLLLQLTLELGAGATRACVEAAQNMNGEPFIRLYHPGDAVEESQLRFYLWLDKESLCYTAYATDPNVQLSIERSQEPATLRAAQVLFEELCQN